MPMSVRTALQHEAVWVVEQDGAAVLAGGAALLVLTGALLALLAFGTAVAAMARERAVRMDENCILAFDWG